MDVEKGNEYHRRKGKHKGRKWREKEDDRTVVSGKPCGALPSGFPDRGQPAGSRECGHKPLLPWHPASAAGTQSSGPGAPDTDLVAA